MSDHSVVVTDDRLPADHFVFEGIDTSHAPSCPSRKGKPCNGTIEVVDEEGKVKSKKCKGPAFSVSEAAKVFFGKTAHWVRWHEGQEHFVLDGVPVGTRRTSLASADGEEKSGYRYYHLADIEKMAHALMQHGVLDRAKLTNTLVLLQTEGRVWGYL